MKKYFLLAFLAATTLNAGERNVLVEVFTNSHCPLCPPAHTTLNSYTSSSSNADRLRFIFYHTLFPYADDQLAQANTEQPVARYNYYGVSSSTPITFFDGTLQGAYSTWEGNLDSRVAVDSPIDIELSGTRNGNSVTVSAIITRTGEIDKDDLVFHMVAVENVGYVGRNGVSPQKFVMRKMITPVAGDEITLELDTPTQWTELTGLDNVTNMDSAGVIAFIQSVSSKEIFQSEYIPVSLLTGVDDNKKIPLQFTLKQNYPNPFNPSTTIEYSLPQKQFVTLTIVDILGRDIATLVNAVQEAGVHSASFDARNLTSGIYFYTLRTEKHSITKKMVLQK